MSKKVSDLQKKKILESFKKGLSLKDISLKFDFSIQTITRQIKKLIGEDEFKSIKVSKNNKKSLKENNELEKDISEIKNEYSKFETGFSSEQIDANSTFFEVAPLFENVNLEKQTDISSKPLSDFVLPNVLYLIVDRNIELEPKILRDYPEWNFLPEEDLQRFTIEIFQEKKNAQIKCKKNQKLIKIPNPKIFLMTSEILKSRGISRIIFEKSLLAL